MTTRHHLALRPPAEAVAAIEPLRTRWDPEMARRTPAHVTLTYPEEAADPALLERAAGTGEFRLALGEVVALDGGVGGVFVLVTDLDGGWAALRARLLGDAATDVPPHLTIVHPRTSNAGPQAWKALRDKHLDATFTVTEVLLTATSDAGCTALGTVQLG